MQQFGSLFGSGARPASQALLHPTTNPAELTGPLSGSGPVDGKVERRVIRVCIGGLTVRVKVSRTLGNVAAYIIGDAHGQVVAIHKRDCEKNNLKRLEREYTVEHRLS